MNQTLARILVHGYKELIREYRRLSHLRGIKLRAVAKQDDAPQTLTELRYRVQQFQCLEVALEHGETSIYGSAKANAWFRAFHDLGHLVYNRAMTYDDEVALATTQWLDLAPTFERMGATPNLLQDLRRLYFIDTVAQSRYCLLTGRFPHNQQDFAETVHDALDWGCNHVDVIRCVDMLVKHNLFGDSV